MAVCSGKISRENYEKAVKALSTSSATAKRIF
jgi:hypothetical protein